MPREIAFLDALIPTLLLVFVGCVILQFGIDWLLSRLRLYRYVWHPSLFRIALFFCIFSGAGLLLHAA
ncbi:DUF1656 domain-containing protein [Glaciimonas sp. PCH181]|uniref:DUF1656 domain-containing protein n=1 Tax=Glaciimonas sp. PCH181 TaxID=2133943 RepID=UPI000D3A3840|nr:DUF1656 domain-containing protein [Glaciimonas sp. PCH181]PUA20473.1 DUF1656 domain-containing protein [Glaciimonas sp. PCH181]